jgi:hypothetical protein
VELTCAEEELGRRLEDASRKEFGKLTSLEQYRGLQKSGAFHFPKLPNGISLDTTNQLPADAARLIRDYVASLSAGEQS